METLTKPDQSANKMDKLNNNIQEKNNNYKTGDSFNQLVRRVGEAGGDRLEFTRSRQLMSRLCASNPQFTASVLEDYIRPVFREGDVVLDIECGTNAALMYLSRLCQGSKGPCIWFQGSWLTPNEFQYISGRETAKDWKRSIRHAGKSMKLLLTKGILSTHPPICDCEGCRMSSPVNRGRLSDIKSTEDVNPRCPRAPGEGFSPDTSPLLQQLFTASPTSGPTEEKAGTRERKILCVKKEEPGRMTEKTDGGGERQEAARREAGPPPRSYSEFMRNLAAKYNTENTSESSRTEVPPDPRLSQSKNLLSLPPGLPLGFPPFLFPPNSLQEAVKDSPAPASPFQFLPGLRAGGPGAGPGFPHGLLPPGLMDPGHAQALLSMMRGQLPGQPGLRPPHPPLDLTESPAKRVKRDSSSAEDPPVSPPPSTPTTNPTTCQSVCAVSQSCSEEGRKILAWSVEQVVEFISGFDDLKQHAEAFTREKIDGSTLVLLTDSHLTSLGVKLGPAIKFR